MALEVARDMSAPATAVWDLLVDTERWAAWGPTITDAVVDHGGEGSRIGPGATGQVRTVAGLRLGFRVRDMDPGRRWTWAVAGVPATGHRVEPLGADCCRVTFEVPVWAAPYLAVCAVALRRIERLAA